MRLSAANHNVAIFLAIAAMTLWANAGITQTEWEKYPGNPVLGLGESWESLYVFSPSVIFDGNKYKMWYTGHGAFLPVCVVPVCILAHYTWEKHLFCGVSKLRIAQMALGSILRKIDRKYQRCRFFARPLG